MIPTGLLIALLVLACAVAPAAWVKGAAIPRGPDRLAVLLDAGPACPGRARRTGRQNRPDRRRRHPHTRRTFIRHSKRPRADGRTAWPN